MGMPMGMTVSETLENRYSVRAYRSDPVPDELIREVFEVARLAPSGSNIQPWHVAVVSGEPRVQLEKQLSSLDEQGVAPNRAFQAAGDSLTGVYRDRRRECGFTYYGVMGVTREDKAGRVALARKNFEFFGAPHVAFFSMSKTMNIGNAADVGIFLGTVMYVMADKGIGCIAQGSLANYPDPVHEIADIPEGNGILFGLSFGFEAEGEHINTVRMPRAPLDDIASFTS